MNETLKSFSHSHEKDEFLNTRNLLSEMLLSDIDKEITETTSSQDQPWWAGFRNKLAVLNLALETYLANHMITDEKFREIKGSLRELESMIKIKEFTKRDTGRLDLIRDLRFIGAEILNAAN